MQINASGHLTTTPSSLSLNILPFIRHIVCHRTALESSSELRSTTDLYTQQGRFSDDRLELRLNPITQVSEISIDFSFLAPLFPHGTKISLKCGKSVLELQNCDQRWNTLFLNVSKSLDLSEIMRGEQNPRNPQSTALVCPPDLAVSGSRKRRHDAVDATRSMRSMSDAGGDSRSAGYARLPESTATARSWWPSSQSTIPQTESNILARKKRRIAPQPVASSSRRTISPNQEINVPSESSSAADFVRNIPSFEAPFMPNYHMADLAGSSTLDFIDVEPWLSLPLSDIPYTEEVVPVMSADWKGKGRETGGITDCVQPMMPFIPPPFPNYPCPTPMARAPGSIDDAAFPASNVTKSSAGDTSYAIQTCYPATSGCIQTAQRQNTREGAALTTNVAGKRKQKDAASRGLENPTKKRKKDRLNPYEQVIRF